MKNLKELTVIIVTFHTPKKIILDCLKSISKETSILIIENSDIFNHHKTVLTEFPHARIICTGKNLGYGGGNNFGIKKTKTDYALILNPDVVCHEDFFSKVPLVINEAKDFVIIGCQYLFDKVFMPAGFFDKNKNNQFVKNFKNNKVESLSKVEWVTGCSMLLNLREFKSRDVFDENFFLYFEEFDLCKSIIKAGKKIYTSNQLKVHHLGFKSSISEDQNENLKKINIKNWHYMWSNFYFYKKNYNYVYALGKILGKFIKSFFKMIFFSITFQKEAKQKYLYRFLGLLSSILGRTSNFRG